MKKIVAPGSGGGAGGGGGGAVARQVPDDEQAAIDHWNAIRAQQGMKPLKQ